MHVESATHHHRFNQAWQLAAALAVALLGMITVVRSSQHTTDFITPPPAVEIPAPTPNPALIPAGLPAR